MGATTTATVRMYAELNDFLPQVSRGRDVALTTDRTSVKDLVERLGVPHTEVDLILVNGEPVGFDYLVRDGDRISVYPVFEAFDISEVTKVRPAPLRELRFAADAHLGRLATFLRLLGFDVVYQNDLPDEELARVTAEEGRVLLTRDRGLLKRTAVERGYCLRSDRLEEQLAEVVRRFDLGRLARPFTRCSRCNGVLVDVAKEAVLARLPPRTRERYDRFQQCEDCGQIYWQGTHLERLRPVLERALGGQGRAPNGQPNGNIGRGRPCWQRASRDGG